MAHIRRVERVAWIIAQEHLQLGITVNRIDPLGIVLAEEHGRFQLLLRACRTAATVNAVVVIQIEAISHRLSVNLTDNVAVVFVVTDDLTVEVAMVHLGTVAAALHLAHDAAYLASALHGAVGVAIFNLVTVVGHIAAESANLIAVVDIHRLHRAVDHRAVGDETVVIHPATEGTHMLVTAVAGNDGDILQPEVHNITAAYPSEESAVVHAAVDIDILDGVALPVKAAGKAVAVSPADGPGLDVVVVQVDVVHQVDGPIVVTVVSVLKVLRLVVEGNELAGRINVDGLGVIIRFEILCLLAVPDQLGIGDVHRSDRHKRHSCH